MTDVNSGRDPEVDRRWSARMAAAQAGERGAYEALLRDCVPVIQGVVRRQGVRPETVDDVVQDVLLTLHRARHTYDPSRSFLAWLATIARRRAIDALRHGGRRDKRELHAPLAYESYADPGANSAEGWEHTERAGVLGEAISSLPSGQREAVEQLVLQDLSLSEAATATGRTKVALKVNFHRALKSLRARLGDKE